MRVYTAAERKLIAEAFTAAVPYLWNGHLPHFGSTYICIALKSAFHNQVISKAAYSKACKVVCKRLGGDPNMHVAFWLVRYNHTTWNYIDRHKPEMQAYRHRWLQALIKEFSE